MSRNSSGSRDEHISVCPRLAYLRGEERATLVDVDQTAAQRDLLGAKLAFRDRHLRGSGIHFCLGANLARAEAALAIGRLLERCPLLEAAGEARFRDQFVFRGLESLPVACGPQ